MRIKEFQDLMKDLYFSSDSKRGIHRTALWLVEEMGELMHQLKKPIETLKEPEVKENIGEEMADIIAWIGSLANLLEIDLESELNKKYPGKCPKCGKNPCVCNKI